MSEQHARLKLRYYKKLEANYQKGLHVLHNADKYINTIEQLYKSNNYTKADRYLHAMDKLTLGFVLFLYSSNPVLNLMLNEENT